MKKILLSLITLFISSAFALSQVIVPPGNGRKIQVAILFDTSNSMDGLIDQAKARIWSIVNEISTLRHNGQAPTIEIALYHYGNDGLAMTKNYIEQIVGLTTDLDLISQKLFGLRTNGGSEYCGAVIGQSLNELAWSSSASDLKMIYIAGNESFNQGPVSYKEECKRAAKKGVIINTIFCGDYQQGVQLFWQDGATCSTGDYFNIDSDRKIVHIPTPYDDRINAYNDSLNQTYYGYGVQGASKKTAQIREDSNAETESVSVKAERSIVKSKSQVYNNASWDIVDGVEQGSVNLETMPEKDLPKEFQGKSLEEKKAILETTKKNREKYQTQIASLAKEREIYLEKERKKRAETGDVDDFGTSVNQSILTKATEKGYKKEK